VHGVEEIRAALGDLLIDAKIPQVGATPSTSYEGDGWMIVRHPETKVVEEAVTKIISSVRVEVG
jgi:hypothetical protein